MKERVKTMKRRMKGRTKSTLSIYKKKNERGWRKNKVDIEYKNI